MKTFKEALIQKLEDAIYADFGQENYDESRFGKFIPKPLSAIESAKYAVKKASGWKKNETAVAYANLYNKYLDKLELMWQHFNSQDKALLVEIIAYRLLGNEKVKLSVNNPTFRGAVDKAKALKSTNETYDPHFMGQILERFNLNPIGYNVDFFFTPEGVAIDFINEQYAYRLNGKNHVEVEKGDVVMDFGACWGDTALYFASKCGAAGKVYSFEFIPDNIKLWKHNVSMNPHLAGHIELVPHPVAKNHGEKIYFKDNGPGSIIRMEEFAEQTGSTTTVSIDALVKEKNITKLDFIKMDIEGTEPKALEGAIESIRKFRPKLAIANYHSMEDFVNIPKWILDLNLDYEIFIGHYTIHHEETVLFAKPKNK